MPKKMISQKLKKIFWWLGCVFAALLSFLVLLVSLLIMRLFLDPIDVSSLGRRFVGTFYLNNVGDFTPIKKKSVGKEVWKNLKIQWVVPRFSDWLWHRNVGDIAFSISGIKLVDLNGNEIDHLHKIKGKIAISLFSKGKVGIKNLEAEGLELRLKKLSTGEVILDFPGVHKNPKPSKPINLNFIARDLFQSVKLEHFDLFLMSEAEAGRESKGAEFKISGLYLENVSDKNEMGKWKGHFAISLKDGETEASITGQRKDEKEWHINANMPAPQDFENILPVMGQVHLPLKAQISGEPILCGLGLKNCHLNFNFQVGEGYYTQPDKTKMRVLKALGKGSVAWDQNYKNLQANIPELDVDWIDLFGKNTKESLHATLGLDNLHHLRETNLLIGGKIPQFNMASLPTLWPQGVADGARDWIVENLTEGQAHDFALDVALKGQNGFNHLKVQDISGGLDVENTTVHWLDKMPPFKGVSVSAKFLDADNAFVKLAGGAITETPKAPIRLSTGSVAIRGVTVHEHQIAGTIKLNLSGSASKLVELLSRDRLPILKRFQKYYRQPQGHFNGKLMLDLPFASWIKADDIIFDAQLRTHDLAANLRGIGQVKAFDGTLSAKNKDLQIKAHALVRAIPVKMDLYQDLTADKPGQEMLKIHLNTAVNQDFLHKIGIPLSAERIKGNGRLEADITQPYSEGDHNQIDMALKLNMLGAEVESLLWRKARNVPAGGALHAAWKDGDLSSVTDVSAYGPDIEIQADTLVKDHHINGIDVSHVKIGKNEGKFRFEWPLVAQESAARSPKKEVQKYILKVQASKVDLEPFLANTSREVHDTLKDQKIPETAKPVIKQKNGRNILPAGDWDINVSVENAFLGKGRILGPLTILANWNKGHLKKADVEITKPYKAFLKVFNNPENSEEHLFEGAAENLGEWLDWDKVYDSLKGGVVRVTGKFAPYIELASVSDPLIFKIGKHRNHSKKHHHQQDILEAQKQCTKTETKAEIPMVHTEGLGLGLPPFAGKISVEGMDWNSSLTGILLAKILSTVHWNNVNGNLSDISMHGAVSIQDGIIGFGNVQGKSDILTATMVGNINLKKEKIDLGGTVSPYYYWNSSPGRLPSILGYLFSPQKGSGVLAMGYTLDGDLSQPHFNLNPYMMLLPGILRKIANPSI